MIGNVKNSMKVAYHAIREKHIPRYLCEFIFNLIIGFELKKYLIR